MSDYCRQCSISHAFPIHDDLVPGEDEGELAEGFGFPGLCEGCGPVIVDYLGQCIGGNCDGDYFSQPDREADHSVPSVPHVRPQVIYRTWESAQVVVKAEREADPKYWEQSEQG